MASCGREVDEDGVEQLVNEMARPKPGSCCSRRAAAAAADAADVSSSAAAAHACCSTSAAHACACASASSAAPPTVAASPTPAAAPASSGGVVPPRRERPAPRLVGGRAACYKCRTARAVINLPNQVACRACFVMTLEQKVKGCIRQRCPPPRASRVLLAVSGGGGCTALAHILREATDPSNPKRLFFSFDLLHVDESALSSASAEECATFNADLERLYASQPHARLLRVPIEAVMTLCTPEELSVDATTIKHTNAPQNSASQPSTPSTAAEPASSSVIPLLPSSPAARSALQSLFSTLRDPTSKADLLRLLRLRLLSHVAASCGYSSLLLGDSASSAAVDVIAAVAKGGGAHVSASVRPLEHRWGVSIAYPMREQGSAAIALYNHHCALAPLVWAPGSRAIRQPASSASAGLNRLASDFVRELDARFASSVPNILSTAAKLVLPPELNDPVRTASHCSLCGRVRVRAEVDFDEANRTAASTSAAAAAPSTAAAPTSADPSTAASPPSINSLPACYACASLLREVRDANLLPPFVLAGVHADHRTADGRSTYPPPLLHAAGGPDSASSNAERAANNTRRRQAEQEAQRAAQQQQEDDPSASPASGEHDHEAPLRLATREEIRASVEEFLLPDA